MSQTNFVGSSFSDSLGSKRRDKEPQPRSDSQVLKGPLDPHSTLKLARRIYSLRRRHFRTNIQIHMSVKILKVFITIRGWERKTLLSPTHSLWLSPTYSGHCARATFLERAWAIEVYGVSALCTGGRCVRSPGRKQFWNVYADIWNLKRHLNFNVVK